MIIRFSTNNFNQKQFQKILTNRSITQCYLTNYLMKRKAIKAIKREIDTRICLQSSPLSSSRVGTYAPNFQFRIRILSYYAKSWFTREVFKSNHTNTTILILIQPLLFFWSWARPRHNRMPIDSSILLLLCVLYLQSFRARSITPIVLQDFNSIVVGRYFLCVLYLQRVPFVLYLQELSRRNPLLTVLHVNPQIYQISWRTNSKVFLDEDPYKS